MRLNVIMPIVLLAAFAACSAFEKPANWSSMTRSDKKAYREAFKIDSKKGNSEEEDTIALSYRGHTAFLDTTWGDAGPAADSLIKSWGKSGLRPDSAWFAARMYDPTDCQCMPIISGKDGKPRVPDNYPNAKYANDTSLWYWKHPSKEFPEMKVYDLKPQYVDSFLLPDGRWIQASKWVVQEWKEEAKQYNDSIQVKGHWVRVSDWEYNKWEKGFSSPIDTTKVF